MSTSMISEGKTPPKKLPIHLQSSQTRILVKGGRCVNDDCIFDGDIYIEDGVIRQIGPNLIVPGGAKIIDARGSYVIPGGIDPHTHMQFPFMGTRTVDDFYSGTKAALAGGTTMIIDFAIPEAGGGSLISAYEKWRAWADERVCCDYGLHVAVTGWKDGKTDKEIETLVKEKGVNSFKCFMAYKDALMIRDPELILVFETCQRVGALPMVHAENGDIIANNSRRLLSMGITGPEGHLYSRPEEVEAEATNRACVLANQVNAPLYVVHVMSKMASDAISDARNRGSVVFGEALGVGLGADGRHAFHKCWRHAAGHLLSPPLRPDTTTPDHLMNLLASGQLQAVGSDHCVFNSDQKALGSKDFTKIPNGVNGVEERMMVVWEKGVQTGKLSPCQFVAVTSTNAAKIFNVYPRKGRLAVGSDADVVVWSPKPKIIKAENHNSLVDFNVFEGMSVSYSPSVVVCRGKIAMDEDGLHVSQGSGRFVPTPPFSQIVYNAIREREKNHPLKVDRSADNGDVAVFRKPLSATSKPVNIISEPQVTCANFGGDSGSPTSFMKSGTRSGVRNLQDSSFKLTGEQIDDSTLGRTAIKVHNPPGGRSSGIW